MWQLDPAEPTGGALGQGSSAGKVPGEKRKESLGTAPTRAWSSVVDGHTLETPPGKECCRGGQTEHTEVRNQLNNNNQSILYILKNKAKK